jgi:ABC-type dipeptide/oligopeptide/nickel transport system permease subunit
VAGAGGLFVMLTVLCANLVGEALEEAFDPKGTR